MLNSNKMNAENGLGLMQSIISSAKSFVVTKLCILLNYDLMGEILLKEISYSTAYNT